MSSAVMENSFKECVSCTYKNPPHTNVCQICSSTLPMFNPKMMVDFIGQMLEANNREKRIQEMYDKAHEHIPESFFSLDMLYFDCSINGHPIKAFVDTGAQSSIMTKDCADRCGLSDLIDKRYMGEAVGVGKQKILGKLWYTELQINDHILPCSFIVLENMGMDIIFGLDMLTSNGCNIDLPNRCLVASGNFKIPFVTPPQKN